MSTALLSSATQSHLSQIMLWLEGEYSNSNEGFWCNRNVVEDAFNEDKLDVVLVDDFPVGFLAYGLTYDGILETHPDFRNRGYAELLVKKAIDVAFVRDEVCILEFECAPKSSVHFWQKMGFEIFEDANRAVARMILSRDWPLPPGDPVEVVVERHCELSLYVSSTPSCSAIRPRAVRKSEKLIYIDQRVVFPSPPRLISNQESDPVARILVDGKEILFTKVKREQAIAVGICTDNDSVRYLDKIRLP